MVQDNPCLTEFFTSVLALPEPSPSILSFTLRLAGLLAASEDCFQHLQVSQVPQFCLLLYGELVKMYQYYFYFNIACTEQVKKSDTAMKTYNQVIPSVPT